MRGFGETHIRLNRRHTYCLIEIDRSVRYILPTEYREQGQGQICASCAKMLRSVLYRIERAEAEAAADAELLALSS